MYISYSHNACLYCYSPYSFVAFYVCIKYNTSVVMLHEVAYIATVADTEFSEIGPV